MKPNQSVIRPQNLKSLIWQQDLRQKLLGVPAAALPDPLWFQFSLLWTAQHHSNVCVLRCSVMSDSAILWPVARQCRLSMGCSRQEHQSGLPGPSPGGSPWPRGRTPISGVSCTASGFFTHWTVGEALSSNNPVLFALGELESISIALPPVISYFKDWCLNFFEKYRNTIKLIREENDLFLLWSISLSRSWELLFKSVITERKSVSASLCKLHVCLWLFLGLSVFLRGGGGERRSTEGSRRDESYEAETSTV